MHCSIPQWAGIAATLTLLALPVRAPTGIPQPQEPASVDLAPAGDAAAQLPRIYSLLVDWHGELILERYYHGARATRLANIKSASKSVVSALVGIAIAQGLIPGVDTPISTFFPNLLGADADPQKRAITIEDLLTMRAGLETTSNRNYGAWVQSSNWVRFILSRPFADTPGGRMIYSTGNTHLLSAILTKVSRKSTWEFARDTLAQPLGINLARWPQDPQGIYFGGNDMVLTPRQMMAFGELYLNRGAVAGKQIIPESWIDASFIPRTHSRFGDDRLYGYGWWMRDMAGFQTYYAWGYGGQFIFIIPDLKLVAVVTSTTSSEDRRGYLPGVYRLVENDIVTPIAAAANPTVAAN